MREISQRLMLNLTVLSIGASEEVGLIHASFVDGALSWLHELRRFFSPCRENTDEAADRQGAIGILVATKCI